MSKNKNTSNGSVDNGGYDTVTFRDVEEASHGNIRRNSGSNNSRNSGSMTTSLDTFNNEEASRVGRPDEALMYPVVAEKEQKHVLFARIIVMSVLLVALAIVTTSMYTVVSNNEKDDFHIQFQNTASEINLLVQDNVRTVVDATEAFGTMITSHVKSTNRTWPSIKIDDFSARASGLVKLTGATGVYVAPVISPDQVKEYLMSSGGENRKEYYEEAIRVNQYSDTSEELLSKTLPVVWTVDETMTPNPLPYQSMPGPFLPMQYSQPLKNEIFGTPFTNIDLLLTGFEDTFETASKLNIANFDCQRNPKPDPETGLIARWDLGTQFMQPIFDTVYNGQTDRKKLKMVGAALLLFEWVVFFSKILTKDIHDVHIVLYATCSEMCKYVTYQVNGQSVVEVAQTDAHNPKYTDMGISSKLVTYDEKIQSEMDEANLCVSEIIMTIYPTEEFENSFYTNEAFTLAGGVAAIFAFTTLVFCIYDITVRRRQATVMARIIRQDKIVLNMFPKAIRDRLYNSGNDGKNGDNNKNKGIKGSAGSHSDGAFSADDLVNPDLFGSGPLAELYPSATVIFADISGFTAWSSAREPPQVFKLLETIYSAFDRIAYRNGVFKVETVGDCYVAVAGVPDECDNHAVAVAKFARDCIQKMGDLTHKLEIILGPDTADLELRVGMHTGQVTAGVLRGDKARFQLFGDTVNTASRMESSSSRSRIQVSGTTKEALEKAGRGKWLSPRDGTVYVKGKGDMQTYWVETRAESTQRAKLAKYKKKPTQIEEMSPLLDVSASEDEDEDEDDDWDVGDFSDDFSDDNKHRSMNKMERLVEWNVEVLSFLLQQILVARVDDINNFSNGIFGNNSGNTGKAELANLEAQMRGGVEATNSTVLDEFKEIITLPCIGAKELQNRKDPTSITLSPLVVSQLRALLKNIALTYRDNPFHNWEHAGHVTASVRKLLTRIVNAAGTETGHSYGITSDPLTQFAVVFSAVIHDADHPGVPNTQLVKENTLHAQIYKKSIAEQNSVDLVWKMLMSPDYDDLRACIYSNTEELKRFRQLAVNTVMATDIVDKELQTLRKARWVKAFTTDENNFESTPELDMNRKATIVIEHLIQASDVSHTMQHWKIYRQWNERFFFELYGAYKAGRAGTDPSIGWYKGEIGFFDFYIIPLAKKLESCGVFGVSSHEYLNYAKSNREEWVREGEQIVQQYLENFQKAQD